jgi:hypothetical protein
MKKYSFLTLAATCLLAVSVMMSSCSKDDPAGPVVTLSSTDYNGETGDVATTTATVMAEAGLRALRITKFIGADLDMSYGTNGTLEVTSSTYTLEYELGEEGVENPIRFNFTAEDENGNTGTADFVVTTEVSLEFLLVNYNWRWHSKLGKIFEGDPETEQILPCEEDNIYIFNADGTMSIDYGPITGTGGGTCDFDGLRVESNWELNAAGDELTIFLVNAFDPADIQQQVYRITSFNLMEIRSEQTVDLSDFGGVIWDWKFTWRAVPK